MVADAGADLFRSCGVGPLAKWVDDHIFFRIPRVHIPNYNTQRRSWQREIQAGGGCRQSGSRLWYGGKELPNGSTEEFDEDCSVPLKDLAEIGLPRSGSVRFGGTFLRTPNPNRVRFGPSGRTLNLFGVRSGSGPVQVQTHSGPGPNPEPQISPFLLT